MKVITSIKSFKKALDKKLLKMKFKKLEITGFKSFFDKTTFLIEEGINRNCWP